MTNNGTAIKTFIFPFQNESSQLYQACLLLAVFSCTKMADVRSLSLVDSQCIRSVLLFQT